MEVLINKNKVPSPTILSPSLQHLHPKNIIVYESRSKNQLPKLQAESFNITLYEKGTDGKKTEQ